MSTGARAAIGVGAIALVVVLFVALRAEDEDVADPTLSVSTTTETAAGDGQNSDKPEKPDKPVEPEIPVIEIKGGQPVGGVKELSFTKGDQIQFIVASDVDEEIHMHVYDVAEEVSAGGRVKFDVPATLDGIFEVELEHSVVPIAEITVNPG